MILIGIGKIDPRSLNFNGVSACFDLQVRGNRYQVVSSGLEQYRVLEAVRPGENVLVFGETEFYKNGHCKLVRVRPRVILQIDGVDNLLLSSLINQILETHLDALLMRS